MNNREIDHLVAEKVMGYRFDSNKRTLYKNIGHGWENPVFDFRPSEDISNAWKVVEKLEFDVKVTKCKSFVGYQCHVFIPDKVQMCFAKTAPMAICLAALKSVGVDVSQE